MYVFMRKFGYKWWIQIIKIIADNKGGTKPLILICYMSLPFHYMINWNVYNFIHISGISIGMRPANKIRRYIVTTSVIGWAIPRLMPDTEGRSLMPFCLLISALFFWHITYIAAQHTLFMGVYLQQNQARYSEQIVTFNWSFHMSQMPLAMTCMRKCQQTDRWLHASK